MKWKVGGLGILCLAAFTAFYGGIFESGFMAAGNLIANAGSGMQDVGIAVAVAVGVGSFLTQWELGKLADKFGAIPMLLLSAIVLAISLVVVAFLPKLIIPMSVPIGAAGAALYTLSVVFGLQKCGKQSAAKVISLAAMTYTVGVLISPSASGFLIDNAGPVVALIVLAVLESFIIVPLVTASHPMDFIKHMLHLHGVLHIHRPPHVIAGQLSGKLGN